MVNWKVLLEESTRVSSLIEDWSVGNVSTRKVAERLAGSHRAGEFRYLVRTHGTTYARRLARKALRYRGVQV